MEFRRVLFRSGQFWGEDQVQVSVEIVDTNEAIVDTRYLQTWSREWTVQPDPDTQEPVDTTTPPDTTITTGIASLDKGEFQLYPNPASEFLIVDVAENFEVSLYDSNGVMQKNFKVFAGESNKIQISELSSGTYLVFLKGKDNFQIGKFLK